jgi:HAD superfamily hydrolase (TIGR01509 family)
VLTRFDLIIFDCDGVVVDSERIVHEVFRAFMNRVGVDLTSAQMHERFLGRTLADCLRIVAQLTGRPVPQSAVDFYRSERDRVLREQVQPVEGIRAVLEQLQTPYCIASSGDHSKMRTTLGATQLLPLFADRIYSATQVAQGKPAPDVFLFAAAQMGMAPERTAVIEDSVNGVIAAHAAGMTTYGFAGLMPAAQLVAAGADFTFAHMSELLPLLE